MPHHAISIDAMVLDVIGIFMSMCMQSNITYYMIFYVHYRIHVINVHLYSVASYIIIYPYTTLYIIIASL